MRIINDIELVSEDLIIRKDDLGAFELKKDEEGKYYYDGGLFTLPYATHSVTLAQSLLETYEDYFYEITKEEYNSEEYKIDCLNKYIEAQSEDVYE